MLAKRKLLRNILIKRGTNKHFNSSLYVCMNNPDLEPLKIQIRIPILSSRIATFLNSSIKIHIF